MGSFSWCTSDTRKSVPCVYDAYEGAPETVYLLNPFGPHYKEDGYDGCGEFGGFNAYELVAEWNRPFLSADNLRKPERSRYADDKEGSKYYRRAMEKYKLQCEGIKAYASGVSDEFMQEIYGEVFAGKGNKADWKRCLGIAISCYEEQQVKLRYPIKIVEQPCEYEAAGISPMCPYQGCIYDEMFTSQIQQGVARVFDELLKFEGQYADEKADALDLVFSRMKMDDVFIAETYPHLIVKDDEGNCWIDGEIYEFVLNECLGFEEDGTLQFGYGAISQELADTLKAHANSYGVKPVPVKRSLDEVIVEADAAKDVTGCDKTVKEMEREI